MTKLNANLNIQKRPFKLTEYDNNWSIQYQEYSKSIKKVLGNNLIEIHHFGSTAIPGMYAKPNIDIYGLVSSFKELKSKYKQMKEAGFTPRGDYSNIGEEYFTSDTEKGERIASIHLFEASSKILDDYRNFHDYLINNEEEKQKYIALKRKLYNMYRDDYPSYDAGKKQLIDEIKVKANNWANHTKF